MLFILFSLTCFYGCVKQTTKDDTLYNQLGGSEGLTTLVESFLYKIADNPKINHFFKDTDVLRFRNKLIEQWCELSGGPCTYTGDNMLRTHAGQEISDAHFNALVEDLYIVMEELNIPVSAQNKLLYELAPMRNEIVSK